MEHSSRKSMHFSFTSTCICRLKPLHQVWVYLLWWNSNKLKGIALNSWINLIRFNTKSFFVTNIFWRLKTVKTVSDSCYVRQLLKPQPKPLYVFFAQVHLICCTREAIHVIIAFFWTKSTPRKCWLICSAMHKKWACEITRRGK